MKMGCLFTSHSQYKYGVYVTLWINLTIRNQRSNKRLCSPKQVKQGHGKEKREETKSSQRGNTTETRHLTHTLSCRKGQIFLSA